MKIKAQKRIWPLRSPFRIARGVRRAATVVEVAWHHEGEVGRGEAVAYARYGQNADAAVAALHAYGAELTAPLSHAQIQSDWPPGGARNALDAALWDWRARRAKRAVWQLMGAPPPRPWVSAFTLSLAAPQEMAAEAARASAMPLLKLKLGGADGMAADMERLAAVRAARPHARLIVDANEGWRASDVRTHLAALQAARLFFLEQPLPRGEEAALQGLPLPLCADESFLSPQDLPRLAGIFAFVNLKLDKSGGLSAAQAHAKAARAAGFRLMLGCMLSSSLSLAPAFVLAHEVELVDLDGALFLRRDYADGVRWHKKRLHPPHPDLWGGHASR